MAILELEQARDKAKWLSFCLEIGYTREQLDELGLIWDKLKDPNYKPEPSFTLQDMLDIHREGAHNANTFCGYPSELNKYLNNCVSDYMRYKFQIDIPKQQ